MTTIKATVYVHEQEPGTHILKKTVKRNAMPPKTYEIPLEECMEARPDWGEYLPLKTLSALERALRKRGAFPFNLPPNHVYFFSFD